MYAASIGLTKTAVETVLKDEGVWHLIHSFLVLLILTQTDVVLEPGDANAQEAFFEPIQKSLDQFKSAKAISRHGEIPFFFCPALTILYVEN